MAHITCFVYCRVEMSDKTEKQHGGGGVIVNAPRIIVMCGL